MADEKDIQTEETQEQAKSTQEEETDWKTLSRKWEARAKENYEKAKEFDKLQEAQLSETEKLNKKLQDAHNELKALKAEKEHNEWVSAASKETGLTIEQLKAIAANSQEELLEKAALFAEKSEPEQGKQTSIPIVLGDGEHAPHKASETPDEWFRSTLPNQFKH